MPLTLSDLPADVRKYIKDSAVESDGTVPSEAVLSAIGVSIAKLRDEAKQARIESGIEDRWRDAEEAYAGIDDANRGEVNGGHQWTKSMSKDGPITSDDVPEENNRSTLYVLMTRRYVDAAAAKIGEIVCAPGAKSFSLSATPLPDLINARDDNRPVALDHLPGSPLAMRALKPGEAPPPGFVPPAQALLGTTALSPPPAIGAPPVPAPGAAVPAPAVGAVSPAAGAAGPLVPIKVSDLAKEKADSADDAAKKAEKRIYDWHVECRRTSEVRKQLFDSSRLGVGVLKGPYPRSSRQVATRKGAEGVELGIRKAIKPGSKWVNAWNFWPDPSCGEDIQDGDHCFEREWGGERKVRKLKTMPGYIKSQIDKVLMEGPQKINLKDGELQSPESDDASQLKKGKYEIIYFHGTLTREEMGCLCDVMGTLPAKRAAMLPPEKEQVYAVVTMINDCVVKATANPLDSGEFPYHPMPWTRRVGSWAGVGVAEQIATPQKIVNAGVRSMLDNAGIAAGGQIVIDMSKITPADGVMSMSPYKIWYLNGEGEQLNVNEAFGLFRIDNETDPFLKIIDFGMRLGEESTSIPLITQGQTGPTTPDTYGAAQLQNSNANQLVRSIGYTYDDRVTVPETNQYYEWLILDPDVPDEEKGDWEIDAHGSSALVEQALQDQFVQQVVPLSVNPAFGLNPKLCMGLLIESKKLNPKRMQYTEEEQAKIAAQPTAAAPQIEVAKINAATKEKEIAARATDTAADNERADREVMTTATIELHTLQLKRELAFLEYTQRQNVSLTQAKAELAKTTMEITAQERLNAQNNAHDLTKHVNPQPKPPVQAPGRAKNGAAFSQATS